MAFSPTTTMAHQCKALQDLTTSVQRLAELFPGHGLLPVAQGSNTKGGSKGKGAGGSKGGCNNYNQNSYNQGTKFDETP